MAIRVSHQPSGAAVGMAAYATGRGRARQRQQKNALDMWQEERREQRRSGNIYRNAIGGRRARQVGQQQQQGTWTDPLALAVAGAEDATASGTDAFGRPVPGMIDQSKSSRKKAVQIKAQRKANARALRMGKPEPYPEAEMQFTPAPTKEEVRRQQKLDDRDENRKYAEGQKALDRKRSAKDDADDMTLGDAEDRYKSRSKQFEEIGQGGRDSWAEQGGPRMKKYYELKNALEKLREDQGKDGPNRLRRLEYLNEGIARMDRFLADHEDTHILPPEKQMGVEYKGEDGWVYENTETGPVKLRVWNMKKAYNAQQGILVPGAGRQRPIIENGVPPTGHFEQVPGEQSTGYIDPDRVRKRADDAWKNKDDTDEKSYSEFVAEAIKKEKILAEMMSGTAGPDGGQPDAAPGGDPRREWVQPPAAPDQPATPNTIPGLSAEDMNTPLDELLPEPKSEDEYNLLPSGTKYKHPDGQTKVKP